MVRFTIILCSLVVIMGCCDCETESPVESAVGSDAAGIADTQGHSLTIINGMDTAFSFYLDGEFKFDVPPGERRTLQLVQKWKSFYRGEVRVGDKVLAERNFRMDTDVEWTIW